jgi:succinate dehydrogenase/fumarate reductase-like Fe-S protein
VLRSDMPAHIRRTQHRWSCHRGDTRAAVGDTDEECRCRHCRACMVEIEGERVLAPSCKRMPAVGMKVRTQSERAVKARAMVMELLVADQPARATSHDPTSAFWSWAERIGVTESRFPAAQRWTHDPSHPAMRVNLDACIQCNLCVRACREVQVNDVIGMAYRNAGTKIVFDFDDPMGACSSSMAARWRQCRTRRYGMWRAGHCLRCHRGWGAHCAASFGANFSRK